MAAPINPQDRTIALHGAVLPEVTPAVAPVSNPAQSNLTSSIKSEPLVRPLTTLSAPGVPEEPVAQILHLLKEAQAMWGGII